MPASPSCWAACSQGAGISSGKLESWLRERTQAKGVGINPQAAALLLSLVGQDLRRLDQELEKLSAYVDYAHPIAPDDVRALVSGTLESNIFALVDALGLRQRRRGLAQLEQLLADPNAHELYVLAMIARQIRPRRRGCDCERSVENCTSLAISS